MNAKLAIGNELPAVSPWLRFSPEHEAEFTASFRRQRLHHFLASGVVALIVYNLFLAVDWLVARDVFPLAITLRLGVFTPLGLAALVLAWWWQAHVLRMKAWVTEVVVLISGVTAALTLAVVLAASSSPMSAIYHAGYVPVIMYGTLVQRLRFRFALAFVACILSIHLVGLAQMPHLSRALGWPLLLMVVTISGFTLVANYRMEFEERQRFLLSRGEQSLLDQLARTYHRLDTLARCDALTGLYNRRHLDHYLEQQWKQAQTRRAPLSLLMLDIDHFKAYNDLHGHPVGDECLCCVARELTRQVLPGEGLIARWGGEEFAIVLPGLGLAQACAMAERLRRAIQGLGLRHEQSPTASSLTVSIGVATSSPGREGEAVGTEVPDQLNALLANADAALYEAKRSGRNVVRPTCGPTPVAVD